MKLLQIVNSEFFQALMELSKMDLPVTSAFKVADILEKCSSERLKFNGIRQNLLEKHGQKTKAGKLKVNKEGTLYLMEDQEKFDSEYQELVELEIMIPTLSLEELGGIKISAQFIKALKPLIKTKV